MVELRSELHGKVTSVIMHRLQYLILLCVLLPVPVFTHGEEVIGYLGMVELFRLVVFVVLAIYSRLNPVGKFILGATYFVSVIIAYSLIGNLPHQENDTLIYLHIF